MKSLLTTFNWTRRFEKVGRISGLLFFATALLTCDDPASKAHVAGTNDQRPEIVTTYTVVLTDTSGGTPAWLSSLRANRLESATLIISGYPNEGRKALLSRLPWLLQPGVDTIYYDPALAGVATYRALADSVGRWSPSTIVKVID